MSKRLRTARLLCVMVFVFLAFLLVPQAAFADTPNIDRFIKLTAVDSGWPADAECHQIPRVCTGVNPDAITNTLRVNATSAVEDGEEKSGNWRLTLQQTSLQLNTDSSLIAAGIFRYKGVVSFTYFPDARSQNSRVQCSYQAEVTVTAPGKTGAMSIARSASYNPSGAGPTSSCELKGNTVQKDIDTINSTVIPGNAFTASISGTWKSPAGDAKTGVIRAVYNRYALASGSCEATRLGDGEMEFPKTIISRASDGANPSFRFTPFGEKLTKEGLSDFGITWDDISKPLRTSINDASGKVVSAENGTTRLHSVVVNEVNGVCQLTIRYSDQAEFGKGDYKVCMRAPDEELLCEDITLSGGSTKEVVFEGEKPAGWEGNAEEEMGDVCDVQLNSPLSWILCPVIQVLELGVNRFFTAANDVLNFSVDEAENESIEDLKDAWRSIRNIANVLFVIAFLTMIISQTMVGKL